MHNLFSRVLLLSICKRCFFMGIMDGRLRRTEWNLHSFVQYTLTWLIAAMSVYHAHYGTRHFLEGSVASNYS
jgi:hypothetical protein